MSEVLDTFDAELLALSRIDSPYIVKVCRLRRLCENLEPWVLVISLMLPPRMRICFWQSHGLKLLGTGGQKLVMSQRKCLVELRKGRTRGVCYFMLKC